MVDIPLQFPQIGNALSQGAHAGYYVAEARQKADEEARRQQAQPFIAGAIAGDPAAFGKVASGDPKTALIVSQALQRMDADKQARVKAAADFTGRATNAILQADPKDRPAIYQQFLEEGRRSGHDLSSFPAEYSPALEPRFRFHRSQSKEVMDLIQKQEEERGRNTRHNTHGGGGASGEVDMPGSGSAPAPRAVSPPPAVRPPGPQSALPGHAPVVAQAPEAPPEVGPQPVVAQAAPPASAGVPPGFEPMGHRGPNGQLVPAMINGQPVYRSQQTGEMITGEPERTALSSGAPGDQRPGSALPGGPQVAQAAPPAGQPQASGSIVYKDPALSGGKIRGQMLPNGTFKPTEGPGGTVKYRMPDNTEVYYSPSLKPQTTERPLPPEGYTWGPDGGQTFIPGGPHDPSTIERNTAARRTAAEKAIPQTVTKGMQENLNALKQIDRVDVLLGQTPKSVGGPGSVAASILPGVGWLQNRIDTEGVNLRALVADIGSMKIHDRSGAAVTASEFPRLRPFIPTIADDEATVRSKLSNFRAELEAHMRDVASYYGPENGFKAYTPATDYLEGKSKGEPGKPAPSTSGGRPPLESFQR